MLKIYFLFGLVIYGKFYYICIVNKIYINMKISRLKYSVEKINRWGDFYKSGHSLDETSKHFNVSYSTVKQNLLRFGFRTPCRKVQNSDIIDITYFENIDTPEKAYLLGLFFADGYVCKTPYGVSSGIALQKQDDYIINEIKNRLQITGNVSYYKNSAKISSTNKSLYFSLQKLGIKEDKSHKDFTFPNIPEKFYNSFILGYFDGDGCITIKNTGYSVVSICCNSKIFLENVKKVLEKNKILCRPICHEQNGHDLYVLYLSKRENQLKFFDFIYKDSTLFLKRKKDKFMQIPR